MLTGLDLSHNNGAIDFHHAEAAGVSFVIVKATQGAHFADPMYHNLSARARSVGLVTGSYHYFTSTQDATLQAHHFLQTADWGSNEITPALDLEENRNGLTKNELQESALTWLQVIESVTGRKPLLYTYPDFAAHYDLGAALAAYPLWWASYRNSPAPVPHGWDGFALWQKSGAGHWPGVGGPVDIDQFAGDLDGLRAIGTRQ